MHRHAVSVLVVDDERSIRQALQAVLASHGFECSVSPTARAALRALQERRRDLLVSDITMPGEDGIWLLQKVKEGYPEMAVIMLTAQGDVKTAMDCLRLGASDYVCKPFGVEDLLSSIANALEKRRLLLENLGYQRALEDMVRQRTSELNRALEDVELSYQATLEALISALDAREHETQNHSRRVQAYTVELARLVGVPDGQLGEVARGALLHDIGKIGVSDNILLKPARLTTEEWREMRRHPEIGYQILKTVPYFDDATRIVRYHHERWDGHGYPYGLKGEEIPIEARLFMVADTFDAMTSDRVYRKALTPEAAIEELLRCSGTQFDPSVVRCFVDNVDRVVSEVAPALVLAAAY